MDILLIYTTQGWSEKMVIDSVGRNRSCTCIVKITLMTLAIQAYGTKAHPRHCFPKVQIQRRIVMKNERCLTVDL